MSRVLELFAKRNLVPSRWVSDVIGPAGRELSIDLQVRGLSGETAHYVARCLRHFTARSAYGGCRRAAPRASAGPLGSAQMKFR